MGIFVLYILKWAFGLVLLLAVYKVLLCALINPAVWLLLKELKAVHEYEADKSVLSQKISSKEYQLLLIKKSVGAEAYALANSFNNNPIKKELS